MALEAFFSTVASTIFSEIFKRAMRSRHASEKDIERIIDNTLKKHYFIGQPSVIEREIIIVLGSAGLLDSGGQLLLPSQQNFGLSELLRSWWSTRVYKITSLQSGKALDVPKDRLGNGARIMQWDYWGGTNQHWHLIPIDGVGTVFKIISLQSGKVLDVPKNRLDNGARIIQWDYWGGTNQHWHLVPADGVGTVFKIISLQSGKVLDVPKDRLDNGVRIIQWDYWGGTNQHWRLEHIK